MIRVEEPLSVLNRITENIKVIEKQLEIYFIQTEKMHFSINFFIGLCPFVLVPHAAMNIFIVCYLAYRKNKVKIQLRNVPHSTIQKIDLTKVKKNLEINNLVYTFLLVLALLELLSILILGINEVSQLYFFSSFPEFYNLFRFYILILCSILVGLIQPIVCLYLIVLRRVYLNLPYSNWIRGYTLYILFKTGLTFLLSNYNVWLNGIVTFLFSIIDFHIYYYSNRKFYLLLRGRSEEARLHSSKYDYLVKQRNVRRYKCAQVFTMVFFLLYIINLCLESIQSVMNMVNYQPNLMEIFCLGFCKTSFMLKEVNSTIQTVIVYINFLQWMVIFTIEFVLSFIYFYICIGIVWKLIRQRERYHYINEWVTAPLMKRYRESLDNPYRNVEQRPPFIQNFRSNTVY